MKYFWKDSIGFQEGDLPCPYKEPSHDRDRFTMGVFYTTIIPNMKKMH